MHATFHVHTNMLELVTPVMFAEHYKLGSSSLFCYKEIPRRSVKKLGNFLTHVKYHGFLRFLPETLLLLLLIAAS
jgi:hypothetical protein